jgi:hypothetical protein
LGHTIKNNDLAAHFPSHFVKGPLLDRILSIDLPNKKRALSDINDTHEAELNNFITQLLHKRAFITTKPSSMVSLASIRVCEQRALKLNERIVHRNQLKLSREGYNLFTT